MKIAGIIAEYNPFHSGHAYHIRRTRELSGCDYVVVCMSGCFTQRGEAACLPVRDRAKAALENGADAVFLLPALWAVRTADAFARGGTAILGGIGCDLLSFGTETGNAAQLQQLARWREDEPEAVSESVRAALERGESHARARGEAIANAMGIDPAILNAPNMVLATEYIRAIEALNLKMNVLPVERIGGYHDQTVNEFASAEAIRTAVAAGDASILRYVPESEREALMNTPRRPMDDILIYRLRTMTAEQAAQLPDVAEGLENRLLRSAGEYTTRADVIADVKCKRYTFARISRACAHAVLGMTKDMTMRHPLPETALLIGAREDARPLLKELKNRAKIPIVTSAGQLKNDEVFDFERTAYDIHSLFCGTDRSAGQLYTQKFLSV